MPWRDAGPPERLEPLARLKPWLNAQSAKLAPHHERVVRPFAQWVVLCKARRPASRGRYSSGAASYNRTQLREALLRLTWLEKRT